MVYNPDMNYSELVLDNSEFYDYKLGDILIDFIYHEVFEEDGKFIVTHNNEILKTHDNYILQYR